MLEVISWIATILSLLGNWMVARKNKYAFPVWIASNLIWIIVNVIGYFNAAQVVMYFVYMFMNLYGWIKWKE